MLAKAVLPSTGQNVELKGKLYNIDSELYDGPFSKVYTVSENGTQFAMKIERTVGPTRYVLPYLMTFMMGCLKIWDVPPRNRSLLDIFPPLPYFVESMMLGLISVVLRQFFNAYN